MSNNIGTLIPHQAPMRLVNEIISVKPEDAWVQTHVGDDFLFLREDATVAPEAFCEIIAQSFAACESKRREDAGLSTEGGGYLVSVRNFEVFALARQGDELKTRVEQQDDFLGTRIVKGEVFRQNEKLAQATVYIFMWEGKEIPTSL